MHHDGFLVRRNPLSESADETDQSLGRVWNAEIRPRREVKVSNDATNFVLEPNFDL